MAEPTDKPQERKSGKADRTDRLKAALKANIARRKAQARAASADRSDKG